MYAKKINHRRQFEEIYVSHYSRMKGFAREYVVREEDAENIVQDIFSEIWEKKLEFSSFVNFNGFLFVALKNKKTLPKSLTSL